MGVLRNPMQEVTRRPFISHKPHFDDQVAGRMGRTDPTTIATPANSVNSLVLDIVAGVS